MVIAALTVNEMISRFPNPVLPLVTAKPLFEDIIMTQKLINTNCISIPSLCGGGHHGHVGLIMTVQEYAAISTMPAASILRIHSEVKRVYTTWLNCDEACKKPTLASYANMYTEAL
jgi:hypothetical protein